MIFISHACADRPRFAQLLSDLRTLEVPYWIDSDEVDHGGNIALRVSQGLEQATHLLICWSRWSSMRPVVLDEISAFYLKDPAPGKILFLRLDETPILTVLSARKYLVYESTPGVTAAAIQAWLKNFPQTLVQDAKHQMPPPYALQGFPRGPLVPAEWISRALIIAYADSFRLAAEMRMAVNEANRMRVDADPDRRPETMIVPLTATSLVGDIPPIPIVFWDQVFEEARRKGPRMLAALLLSLDDIRFPANALHDKAKLIENMRNLNHDQTQ